MDLKSCRWFFTHTASYVAVLTAEGLWGMLLIFCLEETVRGWEGGCGVDQESQRKTVEASPDTTLLAGWILRVWTFLLKQNNRMVPRLPRQPDWIPGGIIKGSFLLYVPPITLPPLNHICSATLSSSTCSNFALGKKKKRISLLTFLLSLFSFLLLQFQPKLTEMPQVW